jgi:uncharacterized protein YjeT (DUF2065 family)
MEKLGLLGNLAVYRVLGIIFLVISATYFLRPKAMIKLDNLGRRLLWDDKWTFRHRIITGLFFLIISLLLIRTGALLGSGLERLGILGNMSLYYIFGGILLLASLGYLFAPKAMKKLVSLGTKSIDNTPRIYGLHPKITGTFFLIVSLILLYTGFFR